MTSLDLTFPPPWAVFLPSAQDEAMIDELCTSLAATNGVAAADAVRTYLIQLATALREVRIDALAALVVVAEPVVATADAAAADPSAEPVSVPVIAIALVSTAEFDASLDRTAQLLDSVRLNPPATVETDVDLIDLAGRPAARSTVLRHAIELRDSDGFAPLTWEVRYAIPIAENCAALLRFVTPSVGYLDEFAEMFGAIAASVTVRPGPLAEPEPVLGDPPVE